VDIPNFYELQWTQAATIVFCYKPESKERNIMTTTLNALQIVDQLGLILDKIEELQEQAESYKDQIKLLGPGTYAGTIYVTTVGVTPEKKTVAWAKAAKEANIPADIVAKYTTVTYNILSATTKALSN
jgi:hypothetical protein